MTLKNSILTTTALVAGIAAAPLAAQDNQANCEGLLQRIDALPSELPENVDWTIEDVRAAADSGDAERCAIIVSDIDRMMQEQGDSETATAEADAEASDEMRVVEQAQTTVTLQDEAVVEGRVLLDREAPNVEVSEGQTEVMVTPGQPSVNVNEQAAEITIREQPARITVEMVQPTIRIEQPAPEIIITMPEPGVDVANAEPQIEVRQAEPTITVSQSAPTVNLELQVAENPEDSQGIQIEDRASGETYAMGETREMPAEEAEVMVTRSEPIVRMQSTDGSEPQVTISRAEPSVTFERSEPQVEFTQSGEPTVEFARAGEPSVTFRQSGEGETQQASAEGETEQPQGAMSATGEESEMAEAGQELEQTEEAAEAELAEAGQELEQTEEAVEAEVAEAGQEIEQGAEAVEAEVAEAGQAIEEGAEEAATETAEAAEQLETNIETETAEVTNEAEQRPLMEVDGYRATEQAELTTEDLTGAPLYSANDEWIGEVSEAILNDQNEIGSLILDVGGFLGLGEHSVEMAMDQVQIMRSEAGNDLRAYVDMSKEELEAMPEYEN